MVINTLETVVATENLTKRFKIKQNTNLLRKLISPKYDYITAVNGLNLKIKKGEIFGLLGPNGAGKTTTIQLLCGLLYPTYGKVYLKGQDLQKNKKLINYIGVMFSDKMLYNRITGYQNLKFFAKLYGIKNYDQRIEEISELLALNPWLPKYVEYYSLGMRTKLAIARTLLHDPEILLLDEPTLGLDIVNASFIRKLLKDLHKTIIITTHYLNEAENLCHLIGFLFKGQMLKIDTPSNLKTTLGGKIIINLKTSKSLDEFIYDSTNRPDISKLIKINDKEIKILIEKSADIPKIIKELSNYDILYINQELPSLEDIFISLQEKQ